MDKHTETERDEETSMSEKKKKTSYGITAIQFELVWPKELLHFPLPMTGFIQGVVSMPVRDEGLNDLVSVETMQ